MDILDSPPTEFWWEVARHCSYATFYHTPLWHRLAVKTDSSRQDRSVGVVFDNGTRAVLPLLEQRNVLKKYVSTFAGCYGGLIADGPIPDTDVQTLYEHVFTFSGKKFKFISNPLVDDLPTPNVEDADVEDDFTHILELDRDLDAIVSEYARGHRSSLNKGRRKGVTVRRGESIEDYRQYYEAYEASLERWGKDPSDGYPWALFKHAHALSQEYSDAIILWLAWVDDAVASGALTFRWNQHVSYWHGAAHEEYFDYRPNNVLHTDIIDAALHNGYQYYDFNPSGGYDGVAQFKSRFGAKKQPVRRRTYTRSLLETVLG